MLNKIEKPMLFIAGIGVVVMLFLVGGTKLAGATVSHEGCDRQCTNHRWVNHGSWFHPDWEWECTDYRWVCPVPTATPTPTDTPKGCEEGYVEVDEQCVPQPTETPSPTSVSEKPFPQPQNGVTVATAYQCSNSNTKLLPVNVHVLRQGDTAIVKWVPTEGDKVNVYYRLNSEAAWSHAVRDEINDGYVAIHGLGNRDWTFGVEQHFGCAGGIVVVVDDASWKLFRASYVL